MNEPILKLRDDRLHFREVDGETVVLDLDREKYLAVNESATVLWRLLVSGATRSALVAALQEEFGLDADEAAGDVDAFVVECRSLQLLERE